MSGRSYWTTDQAMLVIERHATTSVKELANLTGRTQHAVRTFLFRYKHGIAKWRDPRPPRVVVHPRWTTAEDNYLLLHYLELPLTRICKYLKRTPAAVRVRAKVLRISNEVLERNKTRTVVAWAELLGIKRDTLNAIISRGRIKLTDYDMTVNKRFIISEVTMVDWLRRGGVFQCNETDKTPHWLKQIYREVRAEFISCHELSAIDEWLAPYRIMARRGMDKTLRLQGTPTGHQRSNNKTTWYKKVDIYNNLYNCGAVIPRNIKDPYIKAVWLAWESVYVATWELERYFSVKPGRIPVKPICYGVYNRSEMVTWLRQTKRLNHVANLIRQDPVTWQELHADIDRRKRLGQPL